MLSCNCDIDYYDWVYFYPDDFSYLEGKRRKRCCSCNKLIDIRAICVQFDRVRSPYNDIEEKIWGCDVQIASWFMCEWCGEMFFNLADLGYCHNLGSSIKEDMQDYWNLTGFEPSNYKKT